jgi:hypothetical protein
MAFPVNYCEVDGHSGQSSCFLYCGLFPDREYFMKNMQSELPREAMQYDVVIVGAGPAGCAAAIRLKQLAEEQGAKLTICVLEKGGEVGAHILSGAIMDPRALNELIPDWRSLGAPLNTPVTEDRLLFLTETKAHALPSYMVPACFENHGNYVVSLGEVVRWLGLHAEALGVEIFPGFPATEILYDDTGTAPPVRIFSGAWNCMPSTLCLRKGHEDTSANN